jgi:serine/threonine-protein kinase
MSMMDDNAPPSMGRRQMLDRYEILAEIASGGMATVYLARLASAQGFERVVAIKKLHPHLEREKEFIEMFLDEARIAARIHHPNVVATIEFGQTPRGHFLVMDYIEGPTLAKLLSKASATGEPIPAPVAIRIVLDSLAGLQVAHDLVNEHGTAMDVVHRDVSPQNILIGLDGTGRITDFGVARAASRLAVTRTGQLKGKLGYMAPEQARGEVTDRRADVFAMGIILWESLAGRRLFKGRSDSEAETLSKVLYSDIPRISSVVPGIAPALDEICAKALARKLTDRFATCAEFIEALEQAAELSMPQRAGGPPGFRIASARDVAKYVEFTYGAELAQRREALRNLAPVTGGPSPDDIPTTANIPTLNVNSTMSLSSVSSMSAALLTVGAPLQGPQLLMPQEAPRTSKPLIAVLGMAMVVTVAAVVTMVWVVTRPAPTAPALAASTTIAAPSATTSATTAPSASVSASAAPVASAPRPLGGPWTGGKGPAKGPATAAPGGGDGLSSNPYRH